MRLPLYSSIGAFFVNVFFNYVFISGKFGFPRMEIQGAAIGTLIARAFEFAVICGYFFLKDSKVKYRIGNFFIKCRSLLGEYVRVAMRQLWPEAMRAPSTAPTSGLCLIHLETAGGPLKQWNL